MVILLVFHAGDPGSIPIEGNIFSSSILFFLFFIHLVAFYIKFNALAKGSHQPRFFVFFLFVFFYLFFFYKFSNPNRIITVMVSNVRLCHFLSPHFAKFV